jgi:hypothetical protein
MFEVWFECDYPDFAEGYRCEAPTAAAAAAAFAAWHDAEEADPGARVGDSLEFVCLVLNDGELRKFSVTGEVRADGPEYRTAEIE